MRKILLVDDDDLFRASIHRGLHQVGHVVLESRDGNEAIAILNTTQVDMAVIDLLMPRKDGLETIAEIKRRWPGVKMIAISGGGYCQAGMYLEMSLKLGAVLALEKPFTTQDLIAAMARIWKEEETRVALL